MTTVGLVVHEHRPAALALATVVAEWLGGAGHRACLPEAEATAAGLTALACPLDRLAECGLVVSLGGDGTMLRAVSLVARAGVPILGVNLGSLGYLAAVEPADVIAALALALAGEAVIEERAMLAVVSEGSPWSPALALNEAVVEKAAAGRTVRVAVGINGRPFTSYVADGIIVATPTGSTAYAFSARGPIVSPDLEAFQLTPVSPHMAFDRSLILAPTDEISVTVTDGSRGILSVDGRSLAPLAPGEAIVCRRAETRARLVTPVPRDFYGTLAARFGLGGR